MRFLIAFLFVMFSFNFFARASDRKEQTWSSLKISSAMNEQMSLLGEIINRYSHDSDDFTTRSVRVGLQYKFENELKYAFIMENRTASSDANDEIRIIHQLGYSWKLEKMKISTRGRLEQREFSDTRSIANRIRARVKANGTGYEWKGLRPFGLVEYFYGANEVPGRPEGGEELRLQAGVSFKALGGRASISYLDRTVKTPSYQGAPSSETDYGIIDLGLSWKFK